MNKKQESTVLIPFLALCITLHTTIYSFTPSPCTINGMAEGTVPEELCHIRDFIQFQSYFEKEVRNIFLFIGPPGTGKTTSIEKLAQETGASVIHLSGPALISEWQNSGAKAIEKKYQEAAAKTKETKRPVIIFIDEVDAISKSDRNSMHEAYKNTYLELIQQLSAHRNNPNIITILATNNMSAIDRALTSRAETVYWPLPNTTQREAILRHYLSHCTLAFSSNQLRTFAQQTAGFSARDLENLVRSARYKIKRNHIRESQQNNTPLPTTPIEISQEDLEKEIHITKKKYVRDKKSKSEQEDKEYRRLHPYGTDKLQAITLGSQVVMIVGSAIAVTYPAGTSMYHKVAHENKSIITAFIETCSELTSNNRRSEDNRTEEQRKKLVRTYLAMKRMQENQ